ncbi:MAG: 1-deoxy-D-xylulose-5-phosphate synthase [Oscillospiraceae bacterium]|nr:1-deoxy-D-xylulose-5-phosphate synthase [Oscillospiraceae bacterium]
MEYKLLNTINRSEDVADLNIEQLPLLCEEVRHFLIDNVSKTGGHLSANLGTVEAITAMHYNFVTPLNQFVFDVGHQCYTHKIYTGRRDDFARLRKKDGLSGFPSPNESMHDAFISGHGSTSISVAIGLATAKKLKGEPGKVIAMVGDGAFTGGMVYEGLNNVDVKLDNLIVILNDNKMSISKNVGQMSKYLSNLRTSEDYIKTKKNVEGILDRMPYIGKPISNTISYSKTALRRTLYKSTFFEDMGFLYHKVDDGNDIYQMCNAMKYAKQAEGPVFIHMITVKGKGFTPAEENPGAFHGVGSFNVDKVSDPDMAPSDSFSTEFGRELSAKANTNRKLCALTAAMKYGTGLQFFYKEHKCRFFDVGMAEEHAVTFASAMAKNGMMPVVCLYSTFMQRAMDQYIHDTCLLNLNVMFAIDRAGLVPGDGETHQGIHDLSIFSNYDHVPVVCPANYSELKFWQNYLIDNINGPKVIRYPRGGQDSYIADYECTGNYYDLIGETKENIIVCYGRQFVEALKAQKMLAEQGIETAILKLNVINPILPEMAEMLMEYKNIYSFEEHVKNGSVSAKLGLVLLENGFKNNYSCKCVENYTVYHANVGELQKICRIDAESIVSKIKENYEN